MNGVYVDMCLFFLFFLLYVSCKENEENVFFIELLIYVWYILLFICMSF